MKTLKFASEINWPLKRKQLLDQLLYEQPQSLKANTFVSMDSRHKLTRFHKVENVEIFKPKIENEYTTVVSFIPYFRRLVFGNLVTLVCDFLSVFFHLAHLALQNVNKDYVIFLYFCNFVAKSDQNTTNQVFKATTLWNLANSTVKPNSILTTHFHGRTQWPYKNMILHSNLA